MGEPSYYELLKHPEWQKKRLRVMERAQFRCEECGDKETTLNVHHSYYTKGAKPWEYPDESLRCLCEPCHERRHALGIELKRESGQLDELFLLQLLGYAKGLRIIAEHGKHNADRSLTLGSVDEVTGVVAAFADAFGGVPAELVSDVVAKIGPDGSVTRSEFCESVVDQFEKHRPMAGEPDPNLWQARPLGA